MDFEKRTQAKAFSSQKNNVETSTPAVYHSDKRVKSLNIENFLTLGGKKKHEKK